MPLSRHLYSLDEVQAALFYTTTRNTPSETLFWCQEMLLSGCTAEAISTLFQSWIWNTGPLCLQWLIDAWKTLALDELSEKDILLASYQLSYSRCTNRDNSLWNILILTIQDPNKMPDTVTYKTPRILPSTEKKEIYFIRAMFQGKARSAWWVSQYIEEKRVWELLRWFAENIYPVFQENYKICLDALQCYERLLGYRSAEYDIIIRCMAILIVCILPNKQELSFKPQTTLDNYNVQMLNKLELSVGRKDRRLYSIPNACLYGTTTRGKSKWFQHNLTQLYNVEKYLVGCPFWDEVLTQYANVNKKGIIMWQSYDTMEEFFNKYFPDDIPDEWSKADQQKSHGNGILGPNEKFTIWKYSRNFMSKISHLAWNTTKVVHSYLEKIHIDEYNIENIIKLYIAPYPLSQEDLIMLEPVHKIKCI